MTKTTVEWVERLRGDGVRIEFKDEVFKCKENAGAYAWSSDTISLTPDVSKVTLFHELSHWTGNSKRLNRAINRKCTNMIYDYEELIAWESTQILAIRLGFELNEEDRGFFYRFKIKHPTYAFYKSGLAASSYLIHRFGL